MSQANQLATIDAEKSVDEMDEEARERLLIRMLALAATNPADVAFPAMLPMEIAMEIDSLPNICKAYGIDKKQMTAIAANPLFIKAFQEAKEMLKVDGMSFKTKCKMQAESYLETAFNMVKNPHVADSVRADLIKNTVRWAGYDAKAAEVGQQGNSFNIQINL